MQVFEQQHLQLFKKISDTIKAKKQLEEQEAKVKQELEKAMNAYDIKSIDNQFINVTRVKESISTTIDLKELKEKEPNLHAELLEDYPKTTLKKSYLKLTVK
ncbi:hypothetical protein EIM92_00135 [Paenibacillus lentus]|uniref:Uncharacterized protein n=1 Tax=Paenibacillus lentus TaxID=1338368 RepID=A0A3Q8SEN9_9BACL|nr:hypothetical protein EIM92_00135 [Paenibacillus lentus]